MRKLLHGMLFLLFLAGTQNILSQSSYINDFSGELDITTWVSQTGYSHSIVDGELRVGVDKRDQTQGFRISFEAAPLNISQNPVINFKVRADQAIKFRLDINVGVNYFAYISVPQSDKMVDICVDLTGAPAKHDLTKLKFIDVFVNKDAISYSGEVFFDDFLIAGDAVRRANLGGIPSQIVYAGSKSVKLLFKDIQNATQLSASGAEDLIENISCSPVLESTFSNISYLTFDVKDGVEGQGQILVTALGASPYEDATFLLDLDVVSNKIPEMNQPDNVEIQTGKLTEIKLTGITDGDEQQVQNLVITAMSDDQDVIVDEEIKISYQNGSPYASIFLKANFDGSAIIEIQLNDNQTSNNINTYQFFVEVFNSLNYDPTIDPVKVQVPYFDGSESTVLLTGISDGNGNTQSLDFILSSSDQLLVEDASMSVTDFDPLSGTAILHYLPIGEGELTISIIVEDDAAGTNNGPKDITIEFPVKPVTLYPRGLDWDVAKDISRWSGDSGIEIEATTFDGSDVLKVTCVNKWMWGALNFNIKNSSINLTEHPYLSVDIYSPDVRTLHWFWFYDDYEMTNPGQSHRNDFPSITSPAGKARWAEANQWTTITFDFSGENEMSRNVNDEPVPINSKRIVRLLYNYHDKASTWPLPVEFTGTFYMKNIRIGNLADLPDPFTTIDPVADQMYYENPGAQEIVVSGLSNGRGGLPEVSITSSNTAWVNPTISAIQPDGTMKINYTPGAGANESKIALSITAENAQTMTDTFLIKTLLKNPLSASGVTIDMSDRYQVMRGIGTYMNQYYDLYTNEMGATAMRVGIISNQIEPLNDNSDPYVLNREALDYSAFDWDAMRKMKEMGVENFILTSWSAPGWMKDNHSESWYIGNVVPWELAPNRTSPFYYEEWAEFFVAAYRMFEEEAGIQLAGIGIQNEPAFYEPYPSAILSPPEFAKMVVVLGKRLEMEGIKNCQIYMPEQVFSQPQYSMNQFIDALIANPEADKYCDVVATHGYASNGISSGTPDFSSWTSMFNRSQGGAAPKELWMTETHRDYVSYNDAMWIAMAMYGGFEYGNINLWTQWSIVGQHIKNGKPTQMLYTVANFARYIKPGAVRLKSISSNAHLYSSAWVDEKRGELVTVLINDSNDPISTYLTGKDIPGVYNIYLTTSILGCEDMGMSADSLVIVPPRSVMTLVAKGNMAPQIDQVSDQYFNIGAAEQSILLTGISPVEEDQTINLLEASGDNSALIATYVIDNVNPDGTATLRFQPIAGKSGIANITITLSDDGSAFPTNTNTMEFSVMVYDGVNNPPQIVRLNDLYLLEDEEGIQSVAVDIYDGDNGSQNLSGTVSTDNTSLIKNLSFNQTTKTIEFTVEPELYGEASIAVTITDNGGTANNNGNLSVKTDFKVFVASVNDAPLVNSKEDIVIAMNAPEQTIAIEGLGMGDSFGPQQVLTIIAETADLSVLSPPTIVYASGSTASLKLTPVRNKTGNSDVTVTITDNGNTLNGGINQTVMTFNVEIIPADLNHAPIMNPFDDMNLDLKTGAATFQLTGVNDGDDDKTQSVAITAASSDPTVVSAPTVNWVPAISLGSIKLTPLKTGTSTITVTLKDNGGTNYGGIDTQVYTFIVTVINTTGIDNPSGANIRIYPIPANEKLNVELPENNSSYKLTLIDISGRIVDNKMIAAGEREYQLDVSVYDKGLYILQLNSDKVNYRTTIVIK